MSLTIKQEKFAQKFFELGNASAAYREAYNAEGMQAATVWEEASRTAALPGVAARVEELKAASAKQSAITVDDLVAELEEVRAHALSCDQAGAAATAIMGKAKLLGLEISRSEATLKTEEKKPNLQDLLRRAVPTHGTETAHNDSDQEESAA